MRIQTALISKGQMTYVFDEADIRRALMADIRLIEKPGQQIKFDWQARYGEELTATITVTNEEGKE